MKKIITLSIIVFLGGCNSLQKKVCTQDYAHRKGYLSATKGDSEVASSKEASTCQDYEAYSSTMFKQDFKAGYATGKIEYCTKPNYEKWGQEDGHKGAISYPNNYSVDMKICLQDNEFKQLAENVYKKSFQESYCSEERMMATGQEQANQFSNLNSSGIRKHCGKKSKKLISLLRTSYKRQLKSNCTSTFWSMQGEKTAMDKKSQSLLLQKIQKCPESQQSTLTSAYSQAYNNKKHFLLKEEEMALERQRHEDRMQLEEERHQARMALERERLEMEYQNHHRPSRPHSVNYPYRFYYNGYPLTVRCHIDSRRREARVIVKNPNSQHISISGYWEIQFFDDRHQSLKKEKEHEFLNLSGREEEEFSQSFIPHNATFCKARYLK